MKCGLLYIVGKLINLLFNGNKNNFNKSFQILKISRLIKNIVTKTLKVNFDGAGKKTIQNISILQKIKVKYVLN